MLHSMFQGNGAFSFKLLPTIYGHGCRIHIENIESKIFHDRHVQSKDTGILSL